MEYEIISEPNKCYKGDVVYKHNKKDGLCCIEYNITLPENLTREGISKYEIEEYKYRLEKIIKAYCDKKLISSKIERLKDVKIQDFEYEYNYEDMILILKGYNGINSFNSGLTRFISDLDVFLYYYFMSLSKLGQHNEIIKEVIREQHQWHWLKEESNYDNLLIE